VADVTTGGAAEAAGLRRGDVILEMDGRPVTDPQAFSRELGAVAPGQAVRVYIHRPGGEGNRQFVMLERREREP
jgi:S1-C subfamily serine protease